MQVIRADDKIELARFLKRKRALNAYALGDLDEPFWSDTEFFALKKNDQITEIALLYQGMSPPILLAIQNGNLEHMRILLDEIYALLPEQVYAHLSPRLTSVLQKKYAFVDHGKHQIMEVVEIDAARSVSEKSVERLSLEHYDALKLFYDSTYPGHWFRRRMLESGPYFGIKDASGGLICAGGVHVFSERYGVATLGNIVTKPTRRSKGWGTKVTAKLCQELTKTVDTVGLNVHVENTVAVQIYEKLGFKVITEYFEVSLTSK